MVTIILGIVAWLSAATPGYLAWRQGKANGVAAANAAVKADTAHETMTRVEHIVNHTADGLATVAEAREQELNRLRELLHKHQIEVPVGDPRA